MTSSLAISLIALLLSLLSAVYARKAVSEAKQANRISSHTHKLAILESARIFQARFRIDGEATDANIFHALQRAASKASLYFSKPTADNLSAYANAASRVFLAYDGAKRLEATGREVLGEKWDNIYRLVDACRAIEGNLLADLESETQIAIESTPVI